MAQTHRSVTHLRTAQTLKDDMSADLADSQKPVEEDRKSDHAPLVHAKENEVATVTATIETNLRQGGLQGRLLLRPNVT